MFVFPVASTLGTMLAYAPPKPPGAGTVTSKLVGPDTSVAPAHEPYVEPVTKLSKVVKVTSAFAGRIAPMPHTIAAANQFVCRFIVYSVCLGLPTRHGRHSSSMLRT